MKTKTIGAALVLLVLTACGGSPQPGAGAQVDEDTPEYQAYEYRHGLMHVIAFKMGTLRGMAEGERDADNAVFTEYAGDLAALTGMITEGFIPDSAVPGSRALPDIWANWDDFNQKARDVQAAAETLWDATETGGFSAGQSLVQDVGQACGACHRPYRAEEG